MRVVVDASIAIKWFVTEPDSDRALALLRRIIAREFEVHQPVHWLAEVAAVLARLTPERAGENLELLHILELPVHDTPESLTSSPA